VSVNESWSTPAQIAAELAGLEAGLEAALGAPWERPLAWGIMHEDGGGRIVVDRAEAGDQRHPLAMTVLAVVAGDRGGTHTARIDAALLEAAIAMLAPAEACTDYDHPNLRTWRYLREEIGESGTALAVFTRAIDIAEPDDPYVAALLGAIHRGRQENPDGTTTK
jgi:hypothetical protein